MRVGSSGVDQLGGSSVGSVSGIGSDSKNSSSGIGAKSDSVSLSNAANLVALAKASSASRQSKIDNLSAEVKSGRYQADNAQVSRAVVESHISAQ